MLHDQCFAVVKSSGSARCIVLCSEPDTQAQAEIQALKP